MVRLARLPQGMVNDFAYEKPRHYSAPIAPPAPEKTTTKKPKRKRKPKPQTETGGGDDEGTSTPTTEPDRIVKYEKPKAIMYFQGKAITVKQAKDMLGWEEETDDQKFGADCVKEITALYGKKVRCWNNAKNRPIYASHIITLRQEHLRRNWVFNGETIILGKTGLVLNGQHSLISLIIAAKEWAEEPEKWGKYWETEPTMEKLVVVGVDEDEKVIRTYDTGKPQSLADVIYRSRIFADLSEGERKAVSRILDYAIRSMWHRTGADLDAFAPRRTHSEALNFIDRHPKIIECVRHIHVEDGDKSKIGGLISCGYAAALFYLMACSKSDPIKYRAEETPTETDLTFDLWDEAETFWTELAGGADHLKQVKKMITRLKDDEETGGASIAACYSVIIKAWHCLRNNESVTPGRLKLEWDTTDSGTQTLTETPTVGGIDRGDDDIDDGEEGAEEPSNGDPTSEEIEEREAEIRSKKKTTKKRTKKGQTFKSGEQVWVNDPDGEHWDGEFLETYQTDEGATVVRIKMLNGRSYEAPIEQVQREEP